MTETATPELVRRIERFVTSGEGDFDALALEAFAFQYERIPAYRRLCEGRGLAPGEVGSWRRIPTVPASAYKSADRSLALHAAPPQITFRSSGTTQGEARRSVHHHPFPDLYRAVIDASLPRFCPLAPARPPMLSLIPTPERLPDSSLSFMIGHVLERFGGEGSATAFGKTRVELAAVRSWLGARQRDRRPGLILATGLALLQLLDGLERMSLRFRMPAGSGLFETGGLKGRTREVSREELLSRVEGHLGLPPQRVLGEYGMTELTSQLYTRTLAEPEPEPTPDGADRTAFVGPPWVRARILDPETLAEAPEGEVGLIAIFDLANVGSTVHLLTEDLGRSAAGGGFHLAGRAAGAELRGCSLTVEEMAEDGAAGC
jgi:hypothetical protein